MKTRFALVLPLSLALAPMTALAGEPAGVQVGASASSDAAPDATADTSGDATAAPAAAPASEATAPELMPKPGAKPAAKPKIGVSAAAKAEPLPATSDEGEYAPEGTTDRKSVV